MGVDGFDASLYDFDLPPGLIAQEPAFKRDVSRLLVSLKPGEVIDSEFNQIGRFLRPGDCLVLNQTKVYKARLSAQKESGGRLEVFLLEAHAPAKAVPVLLKPAKKVKKGAVIIFPNSGVRAICMSKGEQGRAALAFEDSAALWRAVDLDGAIPLPPYIRRSEGPSKKDEERYQTVFASEMGAVAAPTAGLHFTNTLLEQLREEGIETQFVTHHVGIGTFRPMTAQDIRDHQMDKERFHVDAGTADRLNLARREGRRIITVGTTSTRCLESIYRTDTGFQAGAGDTGLFIYPGYRYQAIDGLITNFHLPKSTLILLVAALIGRERTLQLYKHAIANQYRFYSFGDAMLLIP